jgi:hypothetical protein
MDRDTLMIKLRALMLDIIGMEIYHIDIDEDLREKKSFEQVEAEILKESINKEFNVNIDITSLKPLTLDKIVDYIYLEMPSRTYKLRKPGSKDKPGEKKTLNLGALKHPMVVN